MCQTAKVSENIYPEIAKVVHKDVYVDDCMSGERTLELAKSRADKLEIVLNKGGFSLKGISFSGEDPLEKLSDDNENISVGGMKWFTKDDMLCLGIGEIISAMKLDLHDLIQWELDWDDQIPDDLCSIWLSNFKQFKK